MAAQAPFVGVAQLSDGQEWGAACSFDGAGLSLGNYGSAEAAAQAADMGALAEELRRRAVADRALEEDGLCEEVEPLPVGQHNGFYPCYRQDEELTAQLRAVVADGGAAVAQFVQRTVSSRRQQQQHQHQQHQQHQQTQPRWEADAAAIREHLPGVGAEPDVVFAWVRDHLTQPPASVPEDVAERFNIWWMGQGAMMQELWVDLHDRVLAAVALGDWEAVAAYMNAQAKGQRA